MNSPPPPEPFSQRLLGAVLILLAVLAFIGLFKDLAQRPTGKSRVDWPEPRSVKP
ncbi:MAG TPA: hypothetical protein VG734_26955 [Lacunisphaera sp.]|nr:hypothetical protein [Lacunisphaera sp.]